MTIFDKGKKGSVPRKELKSAFRKSKGGIPQTGGRKYYQPDREKLYRETFGPKYGSQISKGDYRRAIRALEKTKGGTKDRKQQRKIDEQIRYLRDFGGI